MENTRWTCVLSLGISLLVVWLYFGVPPLSRGVLPAPDGSALNAAIAMAAMPLTLAILVGGGLAAAGALSSATEVEATRQAERRKVALQAPAGMVWVVFVAAMAYPLGPAGNIIVVCASVMAILRILQNAIALGVFRAASGPGAAAMDASLGSGSNR
jgi:hypothetical protein